MKRSRIQGHGEEGWGSRGSRFDRGRAIAPELSVDEFSRFAHVRCVSSESRSDPELRVSSPGERPAGREAMVDRRDRLLDRRLVAVEIDRCVAGCIGLDLLSVVLMARLRVASALTGDGGLAPRGPCARGWFVVPGAKPRSAAAVTSPPPRSTSAATRAAATRSPKSTCSRGGPPPAVAQVKVRG